MPLAKAMTHDAFTVGMDSGPPVIFIVDEFGYLAVTPEFEAAVAMNIKTYRNFKAFMWVADQDASTFYGVNGQGQLGNAGAVYLYDLPLPPALQLAARDETNCAVVVLGDGGEELRCWGTLPGRILTENIGPCAGLS